MVETLRVDTDATRSLAQNVVLVHDTLSSTSTDITNLISHVGHGGLGTTLSAFGDKWDHRRQELVEQLGAMSEAATTISEQFEQLDCRLASDISGTD